MNVALISGSPKMANSASQTVLNEMRTLLSVEILTTTLAFTKPVLSNEMLRSLARADTLLFSFPLYVDGIPSQLLSCLCQIEQAGLWANSSGVRVYAVSNCGFFEGVQNRLALELMQNWCAKAGLTWGQGLGIGGGGALVGFTDIPTGHGPKKDLGAALKRMAQNISLGAAAENEFVSINFPRRLYKLMAQLGWRTQVRKNGLRGRDLARRP